MPTLEAASVTPTLSLEQRRIIRAPRARVYEAWTNPQILKKWFGPTNMYCPEATLNVRPGGAYRVEVIPTPESVASNPEAANRHACATGEYTEVIPNERLAFTWSPDWAPGELSLVTVTFADAPLGTDLTIRHERFATEASREGHDKGWAGSFEKLATLLEA